MPKLYAGYKQIYTTRFVNTFYTLPFVIISKPIVYDLQKKYSLLNKCFTNKDSIVISSGTPRTRWTTVPERGLRRRPTKYYI